jgi:ribonuclease VapC
MVEALMRRSNVNVLAFTREHVRAAIDGFRRFGRGRHKAQVNLGDSMTYAIASVAGMPLLFTGDDFIHTDIERA